LAPTNLYKKDVYNIKQTKRKESKMERAFIQAREAEIGQRYLTEKDKLIQVAKMTDEEVFVVVLATGKTVSVPLWYPVTRYDEGEPVPAPTLKISAADVLAKDAKKEDTPSTVAPEVEKEPEHDVKPEPKAEPEPAEVVEEKPAKKTRKKRAKTKRKKTARKAKVTVKAKPKKKPKKKVKKQTAKKKEIDMAKKKSVKQLVVELLKEGPQTRETLAKAIIAYRVDSGNTKAITDLDKVKNFASVTVSVLKKSGEYNIVKTDAGYMIQ
jgi:hypothetical protein